MKPKPNINRLPVLVNRRPVNNLLKLAVTGLALELSCGLANAFDAAANSSDLAPGTAPLPAAPPKPNFIVILMDDMGYSDIEPFGSTLNRTPNLNRLAAEGMKFTSFYAASVCTPSRAQLLSGCQAKRISMTAILGPAAKKGFPGEEKTIAELLKPQGYATMAIGKWHLGDQPEFLPTRHGFDHFLGLPYSNDMGQPQRPLPLPLLRDETVIEAPVEQDKLTSLYTEEAQKFIKANREKPFFLYFAHTAVHVPLNPGKAFAGKSQNGAYGDWVEESDWSVGQILATLRELQLDSKTLVLFTSDNGPWLSRGKDGGQATPLRGGKFTCWEGGVRVPMIAWWPGRIPAGKSCAAAVSTMDLLPTFAGLAGGKPPQGRVIDGKDIWPLLSGQAQESPHEALYFFHGQKLQGLRAGKWKLLIRPQGEGKDRPNPNQPIPALFDLEADPGETTNLAAAQPEVVARLEQLVAAMDKDLGVSEKPGPGVRPCGHVKEAKPLVKRLPQEYD